MLTCDQEIYSIGDAPIITATFRAIPIPPATIGALTNPTTVIFKVTDTLGVSASYTLGSGVTNPSTGIWVCQLPVFTISGRYKVKVTGAGSLAAVARGEFTVRAD